MGVTAVSCIADLRHSCKSGRDIRMDKTPEPGPGVLSIMYERHAVSLSDAACGGNYRSSASVMASG